ncbi:MAG: hypothetical protein OEZ36_12120, partial [Spirochaetota bacterium]|nr:hypothetical protein [Spirochaetota bacterium]
MFFTFMLLLPALGFSIKPVESENKQTLSLVGFLDLEPYVSMSPQNGNSSGVDLAEVRFGFEWKPSKLILVHADVLATGSTEGEDLAVGPGEIYGEVTLSESLPIFIRGGKWELHSTRSRRIFPFVTDSYVTEAAMMDSGAVEIGYQVENFLRVAVGMYDSADDATTVGKSFDDLNDIHAHITISPRIGETKLFFNVGYISHAGDTANGGNYYELATAVEFPDKVNGLIVEFMLDHKLIHALAAGFFRLGDVVEYPVENSFRVELGYKKAGPLFIGALFDYRTLEPIYENNELMSSMRAGGLVGLEIADGAAINLEGWHSFSGLEETKITLQLLFEIPEHFLKN